MNTNLIRKLLDAYKADFARIDKDERYKWLAVKCFQDNWDPDAPDFAEMLKKATAKSANLLASQNDFARGMILEFAQKIPTETRQWFRDLFDETRSLEERVDSAKKTAEVLRDKFYGKNSDKHHYQGLHAISVYLCFRYPEKYYIFKPRAFTVFAKNFGFSDIPKQGAPETLTAYFNMADELNAIIRTDKQLLQMSSARLTPDCCPDPEYRLLTQDVIHFFNHTENKQINKPEVISAFTGTSGDQLPKASKKNNLSHVDLYAQEPTPTNPPNYWWLNANPKIWSMAAAPIGQVQNYTLYNDKKNKRKVFQNFLDAQKGDIIIGYESTPVKQIVALFQVSQEQDGERIYFRKTEHLASPIYLAVLQKQPELAEMEFFKNSQASLLLYWT